MRTELSHLCDVSTTARPVLIMSRIKFQRNLRAFGSIPVVGSSWKTTQHTVNKLIGSYKLYCIYSLFSLYFLLAFCHVHTTLMKMFPRSNKKHAFMVASGCLVYGTKMSRNHPDLKPDWTTVTHCIQLVLLRTSNHRTNISSHISQLHSSARSLWSSAQGFHRSHLFTQQ